MEQHRLARAPLTGVWGIVSNPQTDAWRAENGVNRTMTSAAMPFEEVSECVRPVGM
jgi:hypothetical protein